jgi:hypothetical protein
MHACKHQCCHITNYIHHWQFDQWIQKPLECHCASICSDEYSHAKQLTTKILAWLPSVHHTTGPMYDTGNPVDAPCIHSAPIPVRPAVLIRSVAGLSGRQGMWAQEADMQRPQSSVCCARVRAKAVTSPDETGPMISIRWCQPQVRVIE